MAPGLAAPVAGGKADAVLRPPGEVDRELAAAAAAAMGSGTSVKDGADEGAAGGGGGVSGALPHPAKLPTINAIATSQRERVMGLILLEALLAGVLLVGIVWWTMFSGRKNGEPPRDDTPPKE
jgi:hypothetical protein